MQAMFMLLEAQRWVDTKFPYWLRRAGRDHIWYALLIPAELLCFLHPQTAMQMG